jgi:hypothetical protein
MSWRGRTFMARQPTDRGRTTPRSCRPIGAPTRRLPRPLRLTAPQKSDITLIVAGLPESPMLEVVPGQQVTGGNQCRHKAKRVQAITAKRRGR